MSRPLTQLLPPDLPAGATSPHFGASNPAGVGAQGGHLTSMTNLKSLLQLPIKVDQRGVKDCCEMKGECVCTCARPRALPWFCVEVLKGAVHRSAQMREEMYINQIHPRYVYQFASVVVLIGARWKLTSGIGTMLSLLLVVHGVQQPNSPVNHELSALFLFLCGIKY